MPDLLAIPDLSHEWKKFALEQQILRWSVSAPREQISDIAKCAPLLHEVLVQLIQKDETREQAVTFCVFLLQQNYIQKDALLAIILPALFLYQNLTNRVAVAAGLQAEQLNEHVQEPLYKALTSQLELPPSLLPHLESYLTNFRVQAINPDRQEISKEKRHRIHVILDILVKRSETLPAQLRSSIFCWHTISDFFSRPFFGPQRLQLLRDNITMLSLNETRQTELRQEILDFLVRHVKTDSDITRVIDTFNKTLLFSQHYTFPEHMLLLKEMILLHSKLSQDRFNLQQTIMYIRVVLSEMINLTYLNIDQKQQVQFIHQCLDSLLASIDPIIVRSIQTSQWPPAIANL